MLSGNQIISCDTNVQLPCDSHYTGHPAFTRQFLNCSRCTNSSQFLTIAVEINSTDGKILPVAIPGETTNINCYSQLTSSMATNYQGVNITFTLNSCAIYGLIKVNGSFDAYCLACKPGRKMRLNNFSCPYGYPNFDFLTGIYEE